MLLGNKIIIIGCPGSGKSTLATSLGERFGIHVSRLDDIQDLATDDFIAALDDLMKEEKWILDGNFTKTIERRLLAADTAIFLDFPLQTVWYRALKRYFASPQSWGSDFKETLGLLKYSTRFPRSELLALLERHRQGRQIVILQSKSDVDNLLGNITQK